MVWGYPIDFGINLHLAYWCVLSSGFVSLCFAVVGVRAVVKDVDEHNGGVWKVFKEIRGKLKWIGMADENLKIFKK